MRYSTITVQCQGLCAAQCPVQYSVFSLVQQCECGPEVAGGCFLVLHTQYSEANLTLKWGVNHTIPPLALRRCYAQTVRDADSSHKIDYVAQVESILSLKGYPNRINGSNVTEIWLNGWILPILVELYREGSVPAACASKGLAPDSSLKY